MTLLVRSNPSAFWFADTRLVPETCPESRLVTLATAIASGRYRIDAEAIASRLISRLSTNPGPAGKRH